MLDKAVINLFKPGTVNIFLSSFMTINVLSIKFIYSEYANQKSLDVLDNVRRCNKQML